MTDHTSSPEPDYATFIDRAEAKRLGLTCHVKNHPPQGDYQWDRVRHGKCHPRLTGPRIVAQIESDIRDERYEAA